MPKLIDLFAAGLPVAQRPPFTTAGPIGCRLCGRRFWRWAGVPSHAQKHIRQDERNPQIKPRIVTTIERAAYGGRYHFEIDEKEARYFNA